MPNNNNASGSHLTRRQLTAGLGAGSLPLLGARANAAGSANVLKIGFVSPRTGALSSFRQSDGYVLDLARKAPAKPPALGGQTYQNPIVDGATQAHPSRPIPPGQSVVN